MKTRAEIDHEVKWLRANRTNIRHTTFFGDDNLAAVDAEIDVLDNDLTDDDIFDSYEDVDNERDAAFAAASWRDEADPEMDVAPSASWRELLVKPEVLVL